MATVTLAFSADTEKDADILAIWERWGRGNRSAETRAAIRARENTAGLTLADVLSELDEIKRMLRSGAVVQRAEAGRVEETVDPRVAKAQADLDTLGNGWG